MAELTLRWEKFGLSKGLHEMLGAGELVDVTLACQGEFIQAHKTVLAACSPHFRALFKMNPCQHPIVIMQDVRLPHLQALLNFMYQGEATVNQNELPGFLRTAEALRISGLAPKNQANQHCGDQSDESTAHSEPSTQPPRLSPIPPNKRPRRSKDSGWHDSSRLYIPTQGAGNDYMQSDNIKLEDEISLEEADDWPSCSETNAKEFASMDESNSPNPQATAQVCWFEAGPSSSQAQPGTSTQQQTLPDVSTKDLQSSLTSQDQGDDDIVTIHEVASCPSCHALLQHGEELHICINQSSCHFCHENFPSELLLEDHKKSKHNQIPSNDLVGFAMPVEYQRGSEIHIGSGVFRDTTEYNRMKLVAQYKNNSSLLVRSVIRMLYDDETLKKCSISGQRSRKYPGRLPKPPLSPTRLSALRECHDHFVQTTAGITDKNKALAGFNSHVSSLLNDVVNGKANSSSLLAGRLSMIDPNLPIAQQIDLQSKKKTLK